jgi:dTDP-4-dehydrorhamnose reductase
MKERSGYMAREKEHYRDVVADIIERTGKTMLNANDIRKFLQTRHNTAVEFLNGNKTISVYQFASKLI